MEEERAHTENLQGEMTVAKCKLEEDMFRTRSTLLVDIISMQLFYAVRELSLDDSPILTHNQLNLEDLKGYSKSASTKSKVLENTDLLLELFKGYLNMMNTKGEKLLENSESLRLFIGSEEQTLLTDTEDASLYMANKTDDDKVVASSRFNETPFESHNEVITSPSNEEKVRDKEDYSSLRDKLVSLKNSIDDEALDFLRRAFEFDVKNDEQQTRTRKNVYERIQEFMERRNSVIGKCRDINLYERFYVQITHARSAYTPNK